jgi:hypothetical protein
MPRSHAAYPEELASGDGLSYAYDGRGLRSVVFFTGPTVTSISPASAAQRS